MDRYTLLGNIPKRFSLLERVVFVFYFFSFGEALFLFVRNRHACSVHLNMFIDEIAAYPLVPIFAVDVSIPTKISVNKPAPIQNCKGFA